MDVMESSRLFVKGLPPNITEKDFRRHFSLNGGDITDVKLLPQRRIGYVGYRTHDAAAKAVKYFHRSFIRMSKLSVELARPISDPSLKTRSGQDLGSKPIAPPILASSARTDDSKKRKRDDVDESNPKLREFLEVMKPASKGLNIMSGETSFVPDVTAPAVVAEDEESDGEYETLPTRPEKRQMTDTDGGHSKDEAPPPQIGDTITNLTPPPPPSVVPPPEIPLSVDDDDWLRSRTSRVLDLLDEEIPSSNVPRPKTVSDEAIETSDGPNRAPLVEEDVKIHVPRSSKPDTVEGTKGGGDGVVSEEETALATIRQTARLFLRNLSYQVTADDLRSHFEQFGKLEEVHIPTNGKGVSKGYAMLLFEDAERACSAFQASDGIVFQGRLLHILPAAAKREQTLDEFALAKLPLKTQNLLRKRAEASTNSFNWNSLYMSQDAVNTSIANRLGVSKSDLLDPTSAEAGVKQAIAETSIIQETKAYFLANGVDLNAFKSQKRGDTAILVKGFPHGTSLEELRALFEEHGTVLRVLMPPSGTIAIVCFADPNHGQAAFRKVAYRRIKNSVLFLEKAPKDLFVVDPSSELATSKVIDSGVKKVSVADLLERNDEEAAVAETTSLFVRNLNFSTTTEKLAEAFKSLDGFVSGRVKTKLDVKKPGQVLSMGFGFVEFRTKTQATAALQVMDGFTLDGHVLSVKASHKGLDAAEERRREEKAKNASGQRTKLVVKNLPFEATKKDIRSLLGAYGTLKAVRVPKKFNHSSRGFAFAEFVTPREAENALNALRDTHLLGRKLVIDYAEAEAIDAEEEIAKMQRKVGGQVHKVTLQQLTGRDRARFSIGEADEDAMDV